jgi:hypothetical protein
MQSQPTNATMDSFSESSSVYSDDQVSTSNGAVHGFETEEEAAEARRRRSTFLARVGTNEFEQYGSLSAVSLDRMLQDLTNAKASHTKNESCGSGTREDKEAMLAREFGDVGPRPPTPPRRRPRITSTSSHSLGSFPNTVSLTSSVPPFSTTHHRNFTTYSMAVPNTDGINIAQNQGNLAFVVRPNGIIFGLTQSQSHSGAMSVGIEHIHHEEADHAIQDGDNHLERVSSSADSVTEVKDTSPRKKASKKQWVKRIFCF